MHVKFKPYSLWRVDENIEGAEAVEQGEKGDASGNLSYDISYFLFNLGHVLLWLLLLWGKRCTKRDIILEFHKMKPLKPIHDKEI